MSEANYSEDDFDDDGSNLLAKPMYTPGGKSKKKGRSTPVASDEEREESGVEDEEEEDVDVDDEGDDDEEDVQDQIEKLRIANNALRKQLKDFARAFEASLSGSSVSNNNSNNNGHREGSALPKRSGAGDDGKKSLRAIVASKQRQVASLQKKLEMYRKSNSQLKKQIQQAYTSDRVVQMGNENKEKERQIQQLIEENRNLLSLQRNQAKKMQQQESNKDEWPARLAGLQDELRVTRETLRKYKEKAKLAEEEGNKQREQIVKLQERNRELKKEIERYETSNGKAKSKEMLDIESQQELWDKERKKLEHSINVLEKSNKQERMKAVTASKRAEDKYKDHQEQVEKLKAKIEEKEKDMRYQVIQIKKLKRGLRELAMGDGPLPGVDTPWSANLSKFLNGADDDDEEFEGLQFGTGMLDEVTVSTPADSTIKTPASPQPPSQKNNSRSRGPRIARAEEAAASPKATPVNKTPSKMPAASESPIRSIPAVDNQTILEERSGFLTPNPNVTTELDEASTAERSEFESEEKKAIGSTGGVEAEEEEDKVDEESELEELHEGAPDDENDNQDNHEAEKSDSHDEDRQEEENKPSESSSGISSPKQVEKKSAFAKPISSKKKKKKMF